MTDHTTTIIEKLAEEIQQEIDFGVLSSTLEELGWIRVKLKDTLNKDETVIDWLDKNKVTDYYHYGSTFIFEHSKDAEWFILTWN